MLSCAHAAVQEGRNVARLSLGERCPDLPTCGVLPFRLHRCAHKEEKWSRTEESGSRLHRYVRPSLNDPISHSRLSGLHMPMRMLTEAFEAFYMRMYWRYLYTRGSLSSIGEQPAGKRDGDGESECAATRKNKVRMGEEGPKAGAWIYQPRHLHPLAPSFLFKRPLRLTSYVHAMIPKFALNNAT